MCSLAGDSYLGGEYYLAMDSSPLELAGEESRDWLPESFGRNPHTRGRPKEIDDAGLLQKRQTLLGTFESHWAEFAWELGKAGTLPGLRRALEPIQDIAGLELFTAEQTRKTTWNELRAYRQTTQGVRARLRDAVKEERKRQEALERARGALSDRGLDEKLDQLCSQRQRAHAMVQEEVAGLNQRLEQMEETLRQQEAFIAQSEFVDFLRSGRYTVTPTNLANALAGLPYIAWRQSANRCQKNTGVHPYGFQFQIFERVRAALATPPRIASQATEQVRGHLLKMNPRRDSTIPQLRAEFYYLRVAIESVYASRPPKGALPYKVFAEYQRRASVRSRFDQVMEEEERL